MTCTLRQASSSEAGKAGWDSEVSNRRKEGWGNRPRSDFSSTGSQATTRCTFFKHNHSPACIDMTASSGMTHGDIPKEEADSRFYMLQPASKFEHMQHDTHQQAAMRRQGASSEEMVVLVGHFLFCAKIVGFCKQRLAYVTRLGSSHSSVTLCSEILLSSTRASAKHC